MSKWKILNLEANVESKMHKLDSTESAYNLCIFRSNFSFKIRDLPLKVSYKANFFTEYRKTTKKRSENKKILNF